MAGRLLALLLAGLSLGLFFAYVLEMPPRLRWTPDLWMAATAFGGQYWLFGRVGAEIDVGAILSAAALAHALRRRRSTRFPALLGALLLAAGLAAWALFVAPANAVMAGWAPGTVPPGFAVVRDRWEWGHATVAAAKLAGFTLLAFALLRGGGPRGGGPP